MSYRPHITYDLFSKDKLYPNKKDICFGYWFSQLVPEDEVTFHCEISKKLTSEEVSYFVKFIKRLTNRRKCFEVIELTETLIKIKILRGKSYVVSRMWLTLFRFLQEFPEVVAQFYAERKSKHTINDQIKIFFDLNNSRQPKLSYNNLQGHGIQIPFFDKNKTPVDFNTFKKRIKDENIPTVYGAFVG
jgi:hypothetical protein